MYSLTLGGLEVAGSNPVAPINTGSWSPLDCEPFVLTHSPLTVDSGKITIFLDKEVVAYTINPGRDDKGAEQMSSMIDKVASECVAVRLRMLNRVITNIYDDALRSLDLKVSQMNILVAAAKMGTARPVEVCEYLHLDVSTLSRNVDRMKARGWLQVVPAEDGRSQPFRLTLQGRKLLEKAVAAWSAAQQQVKKVLGDGFVEQLNQAMKRVSKAADAS